ncbi:MAG: hypothetical protein Q7J01_05815 [Syntrophales bacterium]|nr:hypothetical protein [Syntrophales bacterium]
MKLRKEYVAVMFLAVVLMLVFAFSPATAAEFTYDKGPAFTVTYPDVWKETDDNANKVTFKTKMADSLPIMEINVMEIPAGVVVADVSGKHYKALLEKSQDADAELKEEKQITLADGTAASMALFGWAYQGWMPLMTRLVSAYKDGKWVYVAIHSADDASPEVPQSIKFK